MAAQGIQVYPGMAVQMDPGTAVQDRQSDLVDMAQGSLRAGVAPQPLSWLLPCI